MRRKRLEARGRSLTCVCFHVLVKILLHVEVLAAPLAHELLVSDVDAHVGAQLVLVLEPLVTVLKLGRGGQNTARSERREQTFTWTNNNNNNIFLFVPTCCKI